MKRIKGIKPLVRYLKKSKRIDKKNHDKVMNILNNIEVKKQRNLEELSSIMRYVNEADLPLSKKDVNDVIKDLIKINRTD